MTSLEHSDSLPVHAHSSTRDLPSAKSPDRSRPSSPSTPYTPYAPYTPYPHYTPAEIQFYSSLASAALHIPVLLISGATSPIESETEAQARPFSTDAPSAVVWWAFVFCMVLLSGVCYHYQPISGYALLQHISPVTYRFTCAPSAFSLALFHPHSPSPQPISSSSSSSHFSFILHSYYIRFLFFIIVRVNVIPGRQLF